MTKFVWFLIILIVLIIFINIWLAELGYGEGTMRNWSGIVIHHSATETGTVESFRREQMRKHKNWVDVAYHFIIYRDGSVHKGRGLDKQGMHGDRRNWTHLGVCLIGNDAFNYKQKLALHDLCEKLVREYSIISIQRHHSACPGQGINVEKLEEEIFAGI